MRSRLTPDGEKLIITTTEGYIIVIHDLDLSTLSQDLSGFKPSLYRVMQTRGFPLPQACKYNSLFTRKTNRVELISDFPPWNDAEMIASLDVSMAAFRLICLIMIIHIIRRIYQNVYSLFYGFRVQIILQTTSQTIKLEQE